MEHVEIFCYLTIPTNCVLQLSDNSRLTKKIVFILKINGCNSHGHVIIINICKNKIETDISLKWTISFSLRHLFFFVVIVYQKARDKSETAQVFACLRKGQSGHMKPDNGHIDN